MNQLVFQNHNQVVTSSRNIARDFGKRHDHVNRDIDEIIGSLPKNGEAQKMFYETSYIHEQNKQEYRQYLLNRDGFTLLVMGFTGKKAMKFKLQYIEAFNQMEAELKKPKSNLEIMQMAVNELTSHDKRITRLENSMRISGSQEHQLRRRTNAKVVKALGGKNSKAYQEISRKAFSAIWREFKNHFQLPRYSELPKKKFSEGIKFIEMWEPDTSLRIEIQNLNRQTRLEVV